MYLRPYPPILETMGTDVTHCGRVGCGQVVKNPQQYAGLPALRRVGEAIAIGRRNGVAPDVLLPTMAMGSGDSFALRESRDEGNAAGGFPERAFSTRYAIKDLSYALEMAAAAASTWRRRNLPCNA